MVDAFSGTPSRELAAAYFTLADLGRQTTEERWIDPRTGQDVSKQAGR